MIEKTVSKVWLRYASRQGEERGHWTKIDQTLDLRK